MNLPMMRWTPKQDGDHDFPEIKEVFASGDVETVWLGDAGGGMSSPGGLVLAMLMKSRWAPK